MFTKFYCIIVFSTLVLNMHAQRSSSVLRGYAFYQIHMPGFNKMDESGNSISAIDTSYFIYLITKGKVEPKIKEVVFNQFIYQASVFKIDDKEVNIGKLKGTNKTIIIKAERGQSLWRIELQKERNNPSFLPKEYNKFQVVFQKNLHWPPFEIQTGLELQPNEQN